jgi:hypothetical protein
MAYTWWARSAAKSLMGAPRGRTPPLRERDA